MPTTYDETGPFRLDSTTANGVTRDPPRVARTPFVDFESPFALGETTDERELPRRPFLTLNEDEGAFGQGELRLDEVPRVYVVMPASIVAVTHAYVGGQRDANKLTDEAFFAVHPERRGTKLKAGEAALVGEWSWLHDHFVVPFLQRAPAPTAPAPRAGGAAAPAPAATSTAVAASATTEPRTDGVDIYAGNREPDWAAFQREGLDFVIHKSSEQLRVPFGTAPHQSYRDSTFPARWRATRARGIITGSFHFYRHEDRVSGGEQADVVLSKIERLAPGDLAPALDFESSHIVTGSHEPTSAGWLTELSDFLDTIERKLGRTPIIYTRGHIWPDILIKPDYRASDFAYFAAYPLWLVHYYLTPVTVDGHLWTIPELAADAFEQGVNHGKAANVHAAEAIGDWRWDRRRTSVPTDVETPPPWKTASRWAFWQYSGFTPGRFVRGGAQSIDMDVTTDFDVTRGGIHMLEGLADMGRLGVALVGGVPWILRRDADHLHALVGGATWTETDVSATANLRGSAKDAAIVVQGGAVFAYYRSSGEVHEAHLVGGAWQGAAGNLGTNAFHDPRAAANATKRCVAFWRFEEDGRGRVTRNDWDLVVCEAGTCTPATGLLAASGVHGSPSGQPVVYLDGATPHVVGRVGDDGHLIDVWQDAGVWKSADLFADATFNGIDVGRRAATYSPTVYAVGGETFFAYRALRGEICVLSRKAKTVENAWAVANAPSRAVGHPTSFVIGTVPHIVYRAVDGRLYDLKNDTRWTATAIDCGVEIVTDPVAASDGTTAVIAARGIDGTVRVVRFERGAYRCEAPTVGRAPLAAVPQSELEYGYEYVRAEYEDGVGSGSGRTPPPQVPSPFPGTLSDVLGKAEPKLDKAFAEALDAVRKDAAYKDLPSVSQLPIVIVALNADGTRPFVGQHTETMYYSGSMLKIAAMYAAFQLRHAVNELGKTLDPAKVDTVDKFFAAVRAAFDFKILGSSDVIAAAGAEEAKRMPAYERIFDATKDGKGIFRVAFRADSDPKRDFAGHLDKMVVDSHNPSAGFCIQALGYPWMDGLLQKAGLFTPRTKHGIWLAGDYLLPTPSAADTGDSDSVEEAALGLRGRRVVRVPCDNDGTSKQATTCIDAAKLLVLLEDDRLVPAGAVPDTANADMRKLLERGVTGGAPSIVGRVLGAPAPFGIRHAKIGFGTLGTSGNCISNPTKDCVLSETLTITRKKDGLAFAVVYQNVKDPANLLDIKRIRDILQKTIDAF